MEGPSLTVRVPATSANLGTGFDAVGLALTLTADVTLHLRDDGARARRPDPLRRMVLAALRAACRRAERPAPEGIQVEVTTEIPIARGLGASAVARAAGIVAANALLDGPLDDAALLALGAELEGHADNIAPALFGGLQVVAMDGHRVNRVPVALPPGLRCAAFVPDLAMPTRASRELLPKRLSRADAVHNSSRAALLVAALAAGRWDALETAVDDRFHQRARSALFPQMYDLFAAARQAGAFAAYLSGGGSTVMALTDGARAGTVAQAMAAAAEARGIAGRPLLSEPSEVGARIIAQR